MNFKTVLLPHETDGFETDLRIEILRLNFTHFLFHFFYFHFQNNVNVPCMIRYVIESVCDEAAPE